mmetsp:Transcript_6961/g.17210  ORF Transcript_6961/g.17210 Transcript_6961/m.17210 type:complete len:232 (-) Transcript_6961:49-744(-)
MRRNAGRAPAAAAALGRIRFMDQRRRVSWRCSRAWQGRRGGSLRASIVIVPSIVTGMMVRRRRPHSVRIVGSSIPPRTRRGHRRPWRADALVHHRRPSRRRHHGLPRRPWGLPLSAPSFHPPGRSAAPSRFHAAAPGDEAPVRPSSSARRRRRRPRMAAVPLVTSDPSSYELNATAVQGASGGFGGVGRTGRRGVDHKGRLVMRRGVGCLGGLGGRPAAAPGSVGRLTAQG